PRPTAVSPLSLHDALPISADEPAAQDLAGVDVPKRTPPRFRRGTGCEACAQTGYRGRTGIYELLQMNDETRERVVAGAPLSEIRDRKSTRLNSSHDQISYA